jgi:hypothetical protein
MISGGLSAVSHFNITPMNLILTILIIGAVSLTLVNVLRARGIITEEFVADVRSKITNKGVTNKARGNSPIPAPTGENMQKTVRPQIEEIERLLENAGKLIESFQFEDGSEVYSMVRKFYSDPNTKDSERSRIYSRMMGVYDRLMVYSLVSEVKILADKYSNGRITKAEYYSLNMFMRQLRGKLDAITKENPKDKNLLIFALNEYNKALNTMMWHG